MTAQNLKLVGRLDGQDSFVWVSTSQVTWINKSMTPICKQIGPNKRPAYRTKRDIISCIYSYGTINYILIEIHMKN